MSDDSDSDSKTEVILYRDREEWSDLKPVKQNDGDTPVVAMEYTEEFQDVYDYFRGLMAAGEKSERGLDLCADAICLNPANYTVWYYRREILKYLQRDLYEELLFVGEVMRRNPKNYQVWHHRKEVVTWMDYSDEELDFTAEILRIDAKNYHAWQHRRWVVSTFKLFEDELKFVDKLLLEDVRNNSAWTYRYYVIDSTTGFNQEVIDNEINYCISAIEKAFANESVWNYLKGILDHAERKLNEPKVLDYAFEKYKDGIRSNHLQIYLIDAIIENLPTDPKNQEKLAFVLQLLNDLITTYDPIRAKYWTSIRDNLQNEYGITEESSS